MGYSFWLTLLKIFKNLGIVGALAALAAMSGAVGELVVELGYWAPVIALGLQMIFTFLADYLKHKG